MRDSFFLSFVVILALCFPVNVQAQHAFSLHGDPKYGPSFTQFGYVNTAAPKGGKIVLAKEGTFDNLNPFILKGTAAAGAGYLFDTLMKSSSDEASTQYGLLAESISVARNKRSVMFTLRENATFRDGSPVQARDVVYTFQALTTEGHPFYKGYYGDVERATLIDRRRVRFEFKTDKNRELPLILGDMPVLSKDYYEKVPFNKTTLVAPMGSGPYKISNIDPGRSITYVRDPNYWGKDLPVNRGFYNIDEIRFDYYRDGVVAFQAFKAEEYDFRAENVSKNWATGYDIPAVRQGHIIKEEVSHEIPTGMQAFVYNVRRSVFQDPKVREALSYAFDFEWSNRVLFYDAYARTKSFFSNSELAARDLPSPAELELLEPFREQLPEEVFTKIYEPPVSDGSGFIRHNLKKAQALLKEAGWTYNEAEGVLMDASGQALSFEILLNNPLIERLTLPFVKNMKRLGAKVVVRRVDASQYIERLKDFDYDMTVIVFAQSVSPGNEQRSYWGSYNADVKGSRNYIGIQSPVIDDIIEMIINAPNRQSLIDRTRALDRILLWGHYVIPQLHIRKHRLAYRDKFGRPDVLPKYSHGFPDTWWVDTDKEAALAADTLSEEPGSSMDWNKGIFIAFCLFIMGWVIIRKHKR